MRDQHLVRIVDRRGCRQYASLYRKLRCQRHGCDPDFERYPAGENSGSIWRPNFSSGNQAAVAESSVGGSRSVGSSVASVFARRFFRCSPQLARFHYRGHGGTLGSVSEHSFLYSEECSMGHPGNCGKDAPSCPDCANIQGSFDFAAASLREPAPPLRMTLSRFLSLLCSWDRFSILTDGLRRGGARQA